MEPLVHDFVTDVNVVDAWKTFEFMGNYLAFPENMPIANFVDLLKSNPLARCRLRKEVIKCYQDDIQLHEQDEEDVMKDIEAPWGVYNPLTEDKKIVNGDKEMSTT